MDTNNLIKTIVQRDGTVEYVSFTPEEIAAYEEDLLRYQEELQKREQALQRRERVKQLRENANQIDIDAIDLEQQPQTVRQLVTMIRWLKAEMDELTGDGSSVAPF